MPKRKGPEPKPEEQFKEFVRTARTLGVDETGKDLEKAFKKMAPKRTKRPPKKNSD